MTKYILNDGTDFLSHSERMDRMYHNDLLDTREALYELGWDLYCVDIDEEGDLMMFCKKVDD